MRKLWFLPALIWLAAGFLVATASLEMRVGTLRSPGPGFFPLCLSILLIGLSVALIASELRAPLNVAFGNLKRPAVIAMALVAYAISLPVAGFFLTTVWFVFLMLVRLDGRRWTFAAASAVVVSTVLQLVFVRWLGVEMPLGWWLRSFS